MQLGSDDAESALFRIRAEFKEMPGLKLTIAQAARLWQIDQSRGEELLNALVVDGLLQRSPDGAYLLSSKPPVGAKVVSGCSRLAWSPA